MTMQRWRPLLLWIGLAVTGTAFSALLQPTDFAYLGAFRLPGSEERPATFAYGGNAMTFRPADNSDGAGHTGSLFIMGHDRMPYGDLPDGNQVAEISIPEPVNSKRVGDLPTAAFVQNFHDIAGARFPTLDEIPRTGMAYLDHPATGPKIHLAWGAHFQDPPADVASHAWFAPDLSAPEFRGDWFIGEQNLYSVNGYLFDIPADWADTHTAGRRLATGRFRDGGWSGMGPSLFAYRPWIDDAGTPAADGTRLQEVRLLAYRSSRESDDVSERALSGYQHPDEWEGGAWLSTADGDAAVLFAGTKASGDKYWYGFRHPGGAELPCIESELLGEFTLCRLADGSPCPQSDLGGCDSPLSYRGWWSSRFNARFLLYDPADLAEVAAGRAEPWTPQPYAHIDIDRNLLLNPDGIEIETLGAGVQRRYRIGAAAYDRAGQRLYVLELFADNAKPVVHVWRVGSEDQPTTPATSVTVSGDVRNAADTPLNALVLANGAWTFSNAGDGGFSLTAPLDADGRLTLFSFGDGFAPFKQELNPTGDLRLNIVQPTAPADAPAQQVTHQLRPDGESGRYRLTGKVSTSNGLPICALVLANGLFQFSCGGAGEFELTVVPDNQGRIVLMSFADGFLPYRETVNTR